MNRNNKILSILVILCTFTFIQRAAAEGTANFLAVKKKPKADIFTPVLYDLSQKSLAEHIEELGDANLDKCVATYLAKKQQAAQIFAAMANGLVFLKPGIKTSYKIDCMNKIVQISIPMIGFSKADVQSFRRKSTTAKIEYFIFSVGEAHAMVWDPDGATSDTESEALGAAGKAILMTVYEKSGAKKTVDEALEDLWGDIVGWFNFTFGPKDDFPWDEPGTGTSTGGGTSTGTGGGTDGGDDGGGSSTGTGGDDGGGGSGGGDGSGSEDGGDEDNT